MARMAKDILDLVGGTPLVRINRLVKGNAEVYAKLEAANARAAVFSENVVNSYQQDMKSNATRVLLDVQMSSLASTAKPWAPPVPCPKGPRMELPSGDTLRMRLPLKD